MNIYVGNLSYGMTEDALRQAFSAHGTVESARIIKDRDTGQSKGFGFVEMPNQQEAEAAIKELDGADLVCVITPHPGVDYRRVVERAALVLDFRGITRGIDAQNLVRL